MAIVISLKESSAWFQRMGREMPDVVKKGLYSAAIKLQQDLMTNPASLFDKGLYKAGWRAIPTPRGADVYNVTTHGLFIEEGVRAGQLKIGRAVITALMEWAQRHGLGITYVPPTSGMPRKIPTPAQLLSRFAWAVAGAIKQRGLYRRSDNTYGGLHPLANEFNLHGREYIEQEVRREVERSIKP